jgi:hypothetical protein
VNERKYAKYILPAPIMREHGGVLIPGYNYKSVYAHHGELNADITLGFHYMDQAYTELYPHSHPGHEIFCFVGSNPEDISDFDAEIELGLGEEPEYYLMDKPAVVSLPPGMVHGPLSFKRVGKPVFFLEVTHIVKGEHTRTPEGYYGASQKEGKASWQDAPKTNTGKYAKHILPAPIMREHNGEIKPGYNFKSVYAHHGELNADFTLGFHYMNQAYTEVYPHTHAGHEILCFVGSNPKDLTEFDAEIEIGMGEEVEKYTITSPSVVSLPPGLVHGPLTFKRVGKPVFFIETTHINSGEYAMSPEGQHGKK